MKPGPPPTPTPLKLLRGNPAKRPINTGEPKPTPAIPSCPAHLSEAAREEWCRITRELDALGLISNLDRAALAIYCDAYARWVETSEKLKQSGLLVKSPTGFPVQSPYLAIVNKTVEQMRAFVGEFGMTPSSRSRIEAAPPADNPAQGSADREDQPSAACAPDPEKLLTAGELAERLNLPESW